jgi:multicomponent Na+:H+ antiporter subunit C
MILSLDMILYTGAIGLIVIGFAGLVLSRHLFRIILALVIAEAGANLLLVISGFRFDAAAPIAINGVMPSSMVDPVPQAMVLTAIVIGVGVQALALSVVIRIYRAYGSLDMGVLLKALEKDISEESGVASPRSLDAPAGGRPITPPGEAAARAGQDA